jgi:acyl-CoA dehydrogenase
VAIAKWWASEAGHRVAHSSLYLHGGIGNDITYPAHRYYLWARQLDASLGGPAQQLERLGDELAGCHGSCHDDQAREAVGQGCL